MDSSFRINASPVDAETYAVEPHGELDIATSPDLAAALGGAYALVQQRTGRRAVRLERRAESIGSVQLRRFSLERSRRLRRWLRVELRRRHHWAGTPSSHIRRREAPPPACRCPERRIDQKRHVTLGSLRITVPAGQGHDCEGVAEPRRLDVAQALQARTRASGGLTVDEGSHYRESDIARSEAVAPKRDALRALLSRQVDTPNRSTVKSELALWPRSAAHTGLPPTVQFCTTRREARDPRVDCGASVFLNMAFDVGTRVVRESESP